MIAGRGKKDHGAEVEPGNHAEAADQPDGNVDGSADDQVLQGAEETDSGAERPAEEQRRDQRQEAESEHGQGDGCPRIEQCLAAILQAADRPEQDLKH